MKNANAIELDMQRLSWWRYVATFPDLVLSFSNIYATCIWVMRGKTKLVDDSFDREFLPLFVDSIYLAIGSTIDYTPAQTTQLHVLEN